MANLTDITVQKLAPPASGQKLYTDGVVRGLFVRVSQGGAKTFVLVVGGARKYISIGRYGEITLAEARTVAKRILAQRTLGHHEPKTIRFGDAYELFKLEHVARKKARTQHDYTRVIDVHFLAKLKTEQLKAVTYEAVTDITSKLSKTPSEQAHALAVMRTFLRWCARPPRRYIAHSPLEGLQLTIANARKRVLDDVELVKVWRAAEEQAYPHGALVQLLILTGQRRGEIAALRRSWIVERAHTVTLPDIITKNGKEHVFPYGDLAAGILERIPRTNETDLVFASRISDERPLSGFSKFKKEMADGVFNWTLHDLRRTFRTAHAKIGTPPHIAERLINHVAGVTSDVERIYDVHTYMPEMRRAMEAHEAYMNGLLAASPLLRVRAA